MADAKITELTAIDAVAGGDLIPIVDDPAGTPATKKATASQIKDYIIGLANTWTDTQTFANVVIGSANTATWSTDLILTRRGAANLRLGAADAASPVAQTLSVQSVVAGTSNTAGVNLTITGSQGTGTGAGGSIIFQVAPAGSSGTSQNALATALTINPQTTNLAGAVFAGSTTVPRGNGYMFPISGSYAVGMYNPADYTVQIAMNTQFSAGAAGAYTGFQFELTTGRLSWGLTSQDIVLARDAADTLALRRSTNAQAFRIYNTYTDASNYERGKIAWESNVLRIGTEKAGTGTARALELRTDGTTAVTLTTGQKAEFAQTIKTAAPAGGTAAEWKLGTVASVSPTSPNRTIEVDIGGTIYYIHAKTTND